MIDLRHVSGLDIQLDTERLRLNFGRDVEHPEGEIRILDSVRSMLADPDAQGPAHLYTIYMDIYQVGDRVALREQGLLYGSVIYNHGALGSERLRSQGHVHAEKQGTGLRYSEVYEFWTGQGHVYLQKECGPVVTKAYLVSVGPGDKLVIPFGWVHLVVTEGDEVLSFGAWCARDTRFEYDCLQARGGPAYYFPLRGAPRINPRYAQVAPLTHATVRDFPTLGIPFDRSIYDSWRDDSSLYRFLACPEAVGDLWAGMQ